MKPGGSAQIAERLHRLQEEIAGIAARHDREPSSVRLIAVSKTRSIDEVAAALGEGQIDFGENTMQDALSKIPEFESTEASWHFIGHLQSNKTNKLAGRFDWIHSIDSFKLLQRLQHSLEVVDAASLQCLLQVNLSGEESKSGLAPAQVPALMEQVQQAGLDRIALRGLMTIGVADDDSGTANVFAECRELAERIRQDAGLTGFDQLSMGMSGDYALAIAEGATMIRLGTAIFGARDYGRDAL